MSFSFSTPSSAPATSALSSGFSFGANKPATPGFGLAATSQPSSLFGTPATSAPAFGNTSLGSTSFGATAAPAFGATPAPAFGATTAAPAFGAAAPAFGATAAPAFGSTPAFGAATSAPTFGTTPASGTLSTTPFGATTTPSFGLGTGGLNFGAGTNTSASTGLTFGAPTTSTATLGGLGGFPAASSTGSLGFGAFGATSTATTTSSLFGPKLGLTTVTGTLPSTSVTSSLGLGGSSLSSGVAANTNADSKNEPPKQQKLPNEIQTTVESFKEFVKKQKALSSEVMRVSVKPLHTVSREAEATLRSANALVGETARARAFSRRQRAAAAAALAAADAAARDRAATGSELEGNAPPVYVKDLISELEQQLITFRRQMDIADKQMQSSPKLLTEQELNLGFRRMHESLVALAGRLQAVHTQVEAQKEQYLNLRKYVLKDPTNVFDTPNSSSTLDQILDSGRKKPKTSLLDSSQTSYDRISGNPNQMAGPSPFGYAGGLSPFPLSDSNGPSWQGVTTPVPGGTTLPPGGSGAVDSSFTLQKPPGKRGKQ